MEKVGIEREWRTPWKHKWASDSGKKGLASRAFTAGIITALVAAVAFAPAAIAAPTVPAPHTPMVPQGPADKVIVKLTEGVAWLLKEAGKSIVVEHAIDFAVNALPKDGPKTLQQIIATAPRLSNVTDPQTILWQSAGIVGPTNGVIKGDADALFNSMAAAGQKTGSNSLRNGVFTVTLDQGSSSRPPVFTISNAAISKTVMVLK